MASNSTPRLKAYRLDSNYSQANDNDVQAMIDDEFLPVVQKDLNPRNTEMMVGVRARQDGRLVIESNWNSMLISMSQMAENSNIYVSKKICCDGWVLGKGNLELFILRKTSNDTFELPTNKESISDDADYSEIYSDDDGWIQLDRRFWDYSVASEKNTTDTNHYYESDYITFQIGKILTSSTRVFKKNETYFSLSDTNMVCIRYKTYSELGAGANGTLRLPFGDIYNGNRNGRCLHTFTKSSGTGNTTTSIPDAGSVRLLEGRMLNTSVMNFYEGNYLYKRKIYPFRVKVLQDENIELSDFVADETLDNGTAIVESELSWFMDGIMKPVVFERITVNGNKIFKQLTNKQVTVQYQRSNGKNQYIVTLSSNYYDTGDAGGQVHAYPKELFLAYNYVDDCLGNVFDFNYNYDNWKDNVTNIVNDYPRGIGYGHANNGLLLSPPPPTEYVYLKREILAVVAGEGRDSTRDLLLTINGNTASFTVSSNGITEDSTASDEAKEKNRIKVGLDFFDATRGFKIYADGNEIVAGNGGYTIATTTNVDEITNNNITTITISGTNALSLSEVMLSYYEKHPIAYSASGNANPYCIGYRVACYEKVKSATLFVSSFPNWLKGHVNNDLDIFYGNALYSGTVVTSNEMNEDYHDIYPEYTKDGWYPMYSDGAIEFNQEKTIFDYFDVFNYMDVENDDDSNSQALSGTTATMYDIAGGVQNEDGKALLPNAYSINCEGTRLGTIDLQYKVVRYNVAHLDSIYTVSRGRLMNYSNKNGIARYAMLEDDGFDDMDEDVNEAVRLDHTNKKWIGRDDSTIQKFVESGHDQLPSLVTGVQKESIENDGLSLLSDMDLIDRDIATVNTENDRICAFTVPAGSTVLFCFDSSTTQQKKITNPNEYLDRYARIYAKIENKVLYFACPEDSFTRSGSLDITGLKNELFESTILNGLRWIPFEDYPDCHVGTLSGESHECIGINNLQTTSVTVNAKNRTWWIGDENESSSPNIIFSQETPLVPTDDFKNISKNGVGLKRLMYHDEAWGYNVFFEVLSYRYNVTEGNPYKEGKSDVKCAEVVAYRVLTR